MVIREAILASVFVATAGYTGLMMEPELVPLRQPLAGMPRVIDTWSGRDSAPLAPDILAVLGVDDYLTRSYAETTKPPVGLYVGYYQSQRQGDTIHSPMNCLPGAGWQPVTTDRINLPVPGRTGPATVNRVLIQKGMDQQVVLYWYQSHGRVVASEYTSKVWMVLDAVRTNRSDAALVRVVSPVISSQGGRDAAEARAVNFAIALFPHLAAFLPS